MEKDPAMKKAVQGAADRQNEWLAKRIEQADQKRVQDYWKIENDEIIRVHLKPRTELFTPSGAQCPVEVGELSTRRRTIVKFADGREELLGDDWTVQEDAHRALDEKWTGETVFRREDPPRDADHGQGGSVETDLKALDEPPRRHTRGHSCLKPGEGPLDSCRTGSPSPGLVGRALAGSRPPVLETESLRQPWGQ